MRVTPSLRIDGGLAYDDRHSIEYTNESIRTGVILTDNNIPTSAATITIKVNGQSVDASTAKAGDQISVQVAAPFNKVTWTPLFFFSNASIEAEYRLSTRRLFASAFAASFAQLRGIALSHPAVYTLGILRTLGEIPENDGIVQGR